MSVGTTKTSSKPDWMSETITEANVSKEGIEPLDEL